MVDAYDREFAGQWRADRSGWTGNVSSCIPGTTQLSFRAEMTSRVNWYRSMTGLPPVAEEAMMTRQAQASALLSSAASQLSHDPPREWPCYSEDGHAGAGTSNLSLGNAGVHAIDSQMVDAGSNNAAVGHRRWLLNPGARRFGFGSVPATASHSAAASIAVIESSPSDAEPVPGGAIVWPPAGFMPLPVIPARWSLALVDGRDLTAPTVSVTVNGSAVAAPVEHVSQVEYGYSRSVTFLPDLSALSRPGDDHVIVTLTDGARAWRYETTIVALSPAPARKYAAKLVADFLGQNSPSFAAIENIASRVQGPWTPRAPIVEALTLSDAWAGSVVDTFYRDTLGRAADPEGRRYWIGVLREGVPVARVAGGFYGSTEYVRVHGPTLATWVDELYRVLLDRPADAGGRDFWTRRTASTSPAAVALEFYQSVESRRSRVAALYETLLDRAPDQGGAHFWTNRLADGDDLALAKELASSEEYFTAP